MVIKWDNSYSIGVPVIDEQHMKLVDIINKVAEQLENKDGGFDTLLEVVTELDNYVKEHFSFEEALMQKTNYPGYDVQLKQHNALRDKLDSLNIFDETNTEAFFKDMLQFLFRWLINHIANTDRLLGEYLIKLAKEQAK